MDHVFTFTLDEILFNHLFYPMQMWLTHLQSWIQADGSAPIDNLSPALTTFGQLPYIYLI
jgi:hypothetical protein